MFSPKLVGVGWPSEVRLVKRGVGVLNIAWPDVLRVAVNGVLMCIAGPHESLRVEDDRLELVCGLLWNGAPWEVRILSNVGQRWVEGEGTTPGW